jgi:hypothetical protein
MRLTRMHVTFIGRTIKMTRNDRWRLSCSAAQVTTGVVGSDGRSIAAARDLDFETVS